MAHIWSQFLPARHNLRAVFLKHKQFLGWPRLFKLAAFIGCFAAAAVEVRASQPLSEGYPSPDPTTNYPGVSRYYGSVDPNPLGYYSYSYYQGPAFPVTRAIGYYPYPDPHPYPPPPFYPYGYFGYWGWPGYGYAGWGGWGWGPIYPFGFGF
ncbi:MAG TPA: hypothetical protein VEI07_12440 [Planctomycetaceae bacterium]|nr:hypothetical protein [Planctomycetaceae bacterium]